MNAVYKLVFNVSTGTWAVAHELASARGKKSRTRLAAAMALALTLPAGVVLADDAQALQCDVNETISADGLRCEVNTPMTTQSGGIGTMATATELANYIKFNGGSSGVASATGSDAIAIGGDAVASANDSIAMGSQVRNGAANTTLIG